MNHGRRTGNQLVSSRGIFTIKLILTSLKVIQIWIVREHFMCLSCLVNNRDAIFRESGFQAVETCSFGIHLSGFVFTCLRLGSDKQSIILNMILHEIHNRQRVALLGINIATLLILFHLFPCRQLARLLKRLNTFISGHIDRIVVGIEQRNIRAAANIIIMNHLKKPTSVHQLQEFGEFRMVFQYVTHSLAGSHDGFAVQDITLTISSLRLVIDKTDGNRLMLIYLITSFYGHAVVSLLHIVNTNFRASLSAVIGITVFHITNDDMGVENITQTILYQV